MCANQNKRRTCSVYDVLRRRHFAVLFLHNFEPLQWGCAGVRECKSCFILRSFVPYPVDDDDVDDVWGRCLVHTCCGEGRQTGMTPACSGATLYRCRPVPIMSGTWIQHCSGRETFKGPHTRTRTIIMLIWRNAELQNSWLRGDE